MDVRSSRINLVLNDALSFQYFYKLAVLLNFCMLPLLYLSKVEFTREDKTFLLAKIAVDYLFGFVWAGFEPLIEF